MASGSSALALIDCNNFFVSCERLFRPELNKRPVVVLSSNDGCVVSRSNEAKALGIPMGAPAFKYRPVFKEQGIIQFSANFELYGDISSRITRALTAITPRTEVYSVDEAFMDLAELKVRNYTAWGDQVRAKLLKDIGIPVSIGIAPSKTLAKIATERAKQDSSAHNTLDLLSLTPVKRAEHLLRTPIKDVWGVGRRLSPKLRAEGINNALDLSEMDERLAKQLMGIHGRQMVAELNGQVCYPLESFGKVRQSIMHGRMFGEDTNQLAVIEAAVASLTARSTKSLRRDRLLARTAVLQLSTNRFKPGYKRLIRTICFATPTADTGQITSALITALQASYNPRDWYHRANVMLFDLIDARSLQTDLLGEVNLDQIELSERKLSAFDEINERYGRNTIRLAAEDLASSWQPKRALKSPCYTTSWDDLPVIKV